MAYQQYVDAIKAGEEIIKIYNDDIIEGSWAAAYWAVRHASRYVAGKMLDEAKRVGCTAEQLEALRVMATEEAPD